MGLNNTMNLFNLGLSGWHISKTAFEAVVSKGAIGVEAALRGRPIDAAKNILAAPAAPFAHWITGSKMLKEWSRPGSQGAVIGKLMDDLTTGGARAGLDQMYRTQIAENMMKALRQGNLPGAALRSPFAAMEKMTGLIMNEVVPRLKMGTMADMAAADLKRLGPDAGFRDVQRSMAETVNSVDNRMGEVARDNFFTNRYVKDATMFLMRADQYVLGTVREIGGAAVDIARQPVNAMRGDPVNLKRISYVGSMLMFHMAASAIYQKLHTGKWPEEGEDWFFPKNGEVDEHGHPQRAALWSYVKDVAGFAMRPLRSVENKTAPAITLFSDLINNRDFYNVEIRHPDDSPADQAKEIGKFVAKQFEPRSIENFQREGKLGASNETRAEQFFGVGPAAADLNQTPAERLAHELSAGHGSDEPQTADVAERRDLRQQLTRSLHAGKGVPPEVTTARRAGKLSKRDIEEAVHASKLTSLQQSFEHRGIDDAARVYVAADKAEKKQLQPMFMRKARAALKDLPPAQKAKTMQKVRDAIAGKN
jgi:hypothetical protein